MALVTQRLLPPTPLGILGFLGKVRKAGGHGTLGMGSSGFLAHWSVLQTEERPVGPTDDRGEGRSQHSAWRAWGHVVLVQKAHDVMVHAFPSHVPGQTIHVVCDIAIGKMV